MGDRTHRTNDAPVQEQELPEQEHEEPSRQRFEGANGNNVPPVAKAPDEDDERARELKAKVGELVRSRFGGDMRRAFDHYGKDGAVDEAELRTLLTDADIGGRLTRGMWVNGVMKKIDTSRDKKITWEEFQASLRSASH